MAGQGPYRAVSETFSARYGLPTHIVQGIGDTPWETIATMAKEFPEHAREKHPEIRRLQKEINMERLLLTEMAAEQSQEGRMDPKLLVGLIKLLGKCEKMAQDYDIDLREYNAFLALLIEKVKREKLARHDVDVKRSIAHFAPMDEGEIDRMKKRSENYPSYVRKAAKKKKNGRKK